MGSDRRRTLRSLLLSGFVIVLLPIAGAAGAFLLDSSGETRTIRGLEIGGRAAGDMTEPELSRVISRLRHRVQKEEVHLQLPGGPHTLLAADVGITLDEDRMIEEALAAGDRPTIWTDFQTWLGSFARTRSVPLQLDVDRERALAKIGSLDGLVVEKPVEPRLVMTTGERLTVEEGQPGTRVDVEAIVDRLEDQVEAGGPFRVEATTTPMPPSIDASSLEAVAADLNQRTARGITIRLRDQEAHVSSSALRLRLDVVGEGETPQPRFDLDSLQRLIETAFRDLDLEGRDPVFDVVDERPVLLEPGTVPLECCRKDAAERVAAAILDESKTTVRVDPKPTDDPDLAKWAKGEGVVEKVSEFTTHHSCCQGRVDNIQRFADIIRGTYLLPGESLSLNGHVGERTREKGFVPAGTILRGHLVPTVGGGVSQFATTMFNAAFFAGFDFVTYQSHSIYFSRYPYGREATISWPAPDLEFRNTTDYPALIWTSYTDTSITVSIYSTKSVEVEQIGQETSPARACTRVDTYRRRTYEDGTEVEDSVFATYRPGEGLDCNGRPTDRPNL